VKDPSRNLSVVDRYTDPLDAVAVGEESNSLFHQGRERATTVFAVCYAQSSLHAVVLQPKRRKYTVFWHENSHDDLGLIHSFDPMVAYVHGTVPANKRVSW
tara:strand:+ start:367 stop:669 length:303 start_codon:yes stop_codon:yes gene_type:complete